MNYETKETLCYRVDDLCGLLGVSRPTAYILYLPAPVRCVLGAVCLALVGWDIQPFH